MDGGDTVFPISAAAYAASLVGTPDEIWIAWLRQQHGTENHLPAAWKQILDEYRGERAYPTGP